jgi:hypothetical protein
MAAAADTVVPEPPPLEEEVADEEEALWQSDWDDEDDVQVEVDVDVVKTTPPWKRARVAPGTMPKSSASSSSTGRAGSTQEWWASHRDMAAWTSRRNLRAQAHHEGRMPPMPVPGPVMVGQECCNCRRQHRALRCSRKMCGECCLAAGFCDWHRNVRNL